MLRPPPLGPGQARRHFENRDSPFSNSVRSALGPSKQLSPSPVSTAAQCLISKFITNNSAAIPAMTWKRI
jgi:hypothetical protein